MGNLGRCPPKTFFRSLTIGSSASFLLFLRLTLFFSICFCSLLLLINIFCHCTTILFMFNCPVPFKTLLALYDHLFLLKVYCVYTIIRLIVTTAFVYFPSFSSPWLLLVPLFSVKTCFVHLIAFAHQHNKNNQQQKTKNKNKNTTKTRFTVTENGRHCK